jgi:hypothetical protein
VTDLPMVGTASSPMRALTHLWPGHSSGHPEPPSCHQAHRGDEGAHSEHCVLNPCRGARNDRERCSVSPEGSGPKAFESNAHDACFPKRFWMPNNVMKYDGKTNANIWLKDFCFVCRAGGVDDNPFIIQFLPIYFADMARA